MIKPEPGFAYRYSVPGEETAPNRSRTGKIAQQNGCKSDAITGLPHLIECSPEVRCLRPSFVRIIICLATNETYTMFSAFVPMPLPKTLEKRI